VVGLLFAGGALTFVYLFLAYQRDRWREDHRTDEAPLAGRIVVGRPGPRHPGGRGVARAAHRAERAGRRRPGRGVAAVSRLIRVLVLCAVYTLTLASAHPLDILAGGPARRGARRGAARADPARGGPGTPSPLARIAAFPLFAVGLLADVARGTWDVALRVVHLRPVEHPGIVRVPIGDRTPLGVAVSALATTLSPGSVFIDLDEEAGVMLLHVIDAAHPDEVRAAHQRFYDRYQRRVFP
jgi:multisubunit Na+/H+ antiporter MnhE subunit